MERLLAKKFWKAFGEALAFWVKGLFWPQSLQMFFHQDTFTCLPFVSDRGYMKGDVTFAPCQQDVKGP